MQGVLYGITAMCCQDRPCPLRTCHDGLNVTVSKVVITRSNCTRLWRTPMYCSRAQGGWRQYLMPRWGKEVICTVCRTHPSLSQIPALTPRRIKLPIGQNMPWPICWLMLTAILLSVECCSCKSHEQTLSRARTSPLLQQMMSSKMVCLWPPRERIERAGQSLLQQGPLLACRMS